MNSGLAVDINGDGAIDMYLNPEIPFSHIMEEHLLPNSTGFALSYSAQIITKIRNPFFLWHSHYQQSEFVGNVNITLGDIDSNGERLVSVNINRKLDFIDVRSGRKVYLGINQLNPKTGRFESKELVVDFTLVVGEIHG